MRIILRPKDVYGRGNPIPVGRTKFFEDFVEDENNKFVPGTNDTVPRLKAVPLGERAIGFLSDKIGELQEALSQLRNDPSTKQRPTLGRRKAA
jgi:hypothetical protein